MEIKAEKEENMKKLVMVFVAGLIFLIVSVPGLWTKRSPVQTESERSLPETSIEQLGNSDEKRLGAILSEVKGEGKVESMIVFRGGDENGTIEGILVVAEGAQDAEIIKDISDATEALFGIPKHKIIILPMQMKGE